MDAESVVSIVVVVLVGLLLAMYESYHIGWENGRWDVYRRLTPEERSTVDRRFLRGLDRSA